MRNTYQVIYTPQAYEDLLSIFHYIAVELKSEQNAKKQINRIRSGVKKLDFMPERHEIVDLEPWNSMNMHKLPIGNYIVFYLIDFQNMVVTIDRIVYGGRNIEQIINQK